MADILSGSVARWARITPGRRRPSAKIRLFDQGRHTRCTSSAVLPSCFFGYSHSILWRHIVVPHRNRSLRLEMAGQGSGDTKLRCEWHVHRLSHRESSSHGQVRGLYITVMIQFHEFRRALAPGAHRPVRSLSAQDGEDSSRPACAAGPQPSSKARLFLPVLSLSEARVPV